jgi:hypothetical protein
MNMNRSKHAQKKSKESRRSISILGWTGIDCGEINMRQLEDLFSPQNQIDQLCLA